MNRKDLPPIDGRSFFRKHAGVARRGILTAGAFVGGGVLLLMLVQPYRCPFLSLTGIPCPGCGMTRALCHLLQGNFRVAFSYNPLVFVLPLYLFLIACDATPFARRSWNRWLWGAALWLSALIDSLRI